MQTGATPDKTAMGDGQATEGGATTISASGDKRRDPPERVSSKAARCLTLKWGATQLQGIVAISPEMSNLTAQLVIADRESRSRNIASRSSLWL